MTASSCRFVKRRRVAGYPRLFRTSFPFICLILLFVAASRVSAQVRLDEWITYSSMVDVRAADTDADGLTWFATSGGVFSHDSRTDAYREYRNIDALSELNITALKVDPVENFVYAGSVNGFVDIWDGEQWINIRDINDNSDDFPSVTVNDFLFTPEVVIVATDFGMVLFDRATRTFPSTITNFAGQREISVRQMMIIDNVIWGATSVGVIRAELTPQFFAFPSNPANWEMFAVGFDDPLVTDVTVLNGVVHVSNANRILRFEDGAFVEVREIELEVNSMTVINGELFAMTPFDIRNIEGGVYYGNNDLARAFASVDTLRRDGVDELHILTSTIGAFTLDAQTQANPPVAPNTPAGNRFRDLTVDESGVLWCASAHPAGSGVYRLIDGAWENFTRTTREEIESNDIYRIQAMNDGSVWAGSWGNGAYRFGPQSPPQIDLFDEQNSPLQGFDSNNPSFVLLGDIKRDEFRGYTWLLNKDGDRLVSWSETAGFETFNINREIDMLFLSIDASGTKWIGGDADRGLWYFNERFDRAASSDDVFGTLNTSNSPLQENSQTTVEVDLSDQVWIGSARNLYVIANPFAVLTGDRIFLRSITDLAGQFVNDIMVDPVNNKWVATNNGVWVINDDGTEVLAQITTRNSPLVSNEVLSLANDPNSGRVYMGTDDGLSCVQTLSVRANPDFSDLRCYPQPYIPTEDDELVIDGLAEQSTVKVSTLDGMLVRSLSALNSRTVIWDGLDERGQPAPSGVYIISSFSETLSEAGQTKAVLIRR